MKLERCDKCGAYKKGRIRMTIRYILAKCRADLMALVGIPLASFFLGFLFGITFRT